MKIKEVAEGLEQRDQIRYASKIAPERRHSITEHVYVLAETARRVVKETAKPMTAEDAINLLEDLDRADHLGEVLEQSEVDDDVVRKVATLFADRHSYPACAQRRLQDGAACIRDLFVSPPPRERAWTTLSLCPEGNPLLMPEC